MTEKAYRTQISRRAWYEWLGWAVWLFALVFTFQNALASGAEYEPTAATIFWVVFAVLAIGGGIVYFLRRQRPS